MVFFFPPKTTQPCAFYHIDPFVKETKTLMDNTGLNEKYFLHCFSESDFVKVSLLTLWRNVLRRAFDFAEKWIHYLTIILIFKKSVEIRTGGRGWNSVLYLSNTFAEESVWGCVLCLLSSHRSVEMWETNVFGSLVAFSIYFKHS